MLNAQKLYEFLSNIPQEEREKLDVDIWDDYHESNRGADNIQVTTDEWATYVLIS